MNNCLFIPFNSIKLLFLHPVVTDRVKNATINAQSWFQAIFMIVNDNTLRPVRCLFLLQLYNSIISIICWITYSLDVFHPPSYILKMMKIMTETSILPKKSS